MTIKTVPQKGFIFWPVGTGDSTTVIVNNAVFLQIDLRHMEKSENDDDPAWAVVDELIEILPQKDGKPYLSTFALTHPDKDHCQGFAELNERVHISELWMSPRTFREFKGNNDLCDDAEAFYKEAMRRVKKTIVARGDPGTGDRIRIIGYDELLKEEEFAGFPNSFLSVPGSTITVLDGEAHASQFQAFVHAPFKDDSYGDRNDCSLAFQIVLINGEGIGRAMLMGDLKYPIVRRIFDTSDAPTLSWNVLLAPHHCSKSVMYWQNEGEDNKILKTDIIRDLGNAALDPGYIVSSSVPIPQRNEEGDNPPHALAKAEYETIVTEFFCTHEHPSVAKPVPVVFEVSPTGFSYVGEEVLSQPLDDAIDKAGPGGQPPKIAIGFGDCGSY